MRSIQNNSSGKVSGGWFVTNYISVRYCRSVKGRRFLQCRKFLCIEIKKRQFWAHPCICTVSSYALLSVWTWLDQNSDLTKNQTWPKINLALKAECSLHSAYTACTLPVHCRCTPVQAGPKQRQVGSLQRQVAFFGTFSSVSEVSTYIFFPTILYSHTFHICYTV